MPQELSKVQRSYKERGEERRGKKRKGRESKISGTLQKISIQAKVYKLYCSFQCRLTHGSLILNFGYG